MEETVSSTGLTSKDISVTSASPSQSPIKYEKASESPYTGSEKHEEIIGGDVTLKEEPGQPLKLSRSTSQKVVSRPPTLYNDHSSKTEEARTSFQVIPECTYTSKYIGSTEHDSMDCDCVEEWVRAISAFSTTLGSKGILISVSRSSHKNQLIMWGRLGLHQSCDQDGVCWRLRVRS